jgi:hypothetical protein
MIKIDETKLIKLVKAGKVDETLGYINDAVYKSTKPRTRTRRKNALNKLATTNKHSLRSNVIDSCGFHTYDDKNICVTDLMLMVVLDRQSIDFDYQEKTESHIALSASKVYSRYNIKELGISIDKGKLAVKTVELKTKKRRNEDIDSYTENIDSEVGFYHVTGDSYIQVKHLNMIDDIIGLDKCKLFINDSSDVMYFESEKEGKAMCTLKKKKQYNNSL